MSELIKKTSQKNINIYNFIWNSIRGNRISFFIFAFLEFVNDIIGIFIAQYFNKKNGRIFKHRKPDTNHGFILCINLCLFSKYYIYYKK